MGKTKLPAYPAFDWLRFLLALIVALYHFGLIPWSHAGNLAVQVFFALSGWLIGGILLGGAPKHLPRFYFNRATRIWIPYFAALALFYGWSAIHDPINVQWFEYLIFDATFTHNLFTSPLYAASNNLPLLGTGVFFWSISVEEQFYLAAPLVIYGQRFGKLPLLWAGLAVLLIIGHQTDFASIAAGVSAASIRRLRGEWHIRPAAALLLVSTIAAVAVAFLFVPDCYDYAAPLFGVSIVLLLARAGRRTQKGKFLGGISYPMYLNHWIGGLGAHGVTRHIFAALAPVDGYIASCGSVLVGAVVYLLIDKNIMTRRGEWYSPRLGIILAGTAYLVLAIGVVFGTTVIFLI